ncbi:YaeQ family protein [Photobacterium minamisatsumaniensis]|uniref:YaeQ family protein n=1 Tax=Photobacterium minamisatsumaniensis TaxID=2910233 RepID=UPI003D0B609A
MALKATIYKAQFNVADLDRHVYIDKSHTLACHPSETLQRLMLRLIAWGFYADEDLQFTKGLCDVDEPDLWIKSLSDEIELWIDLGLPDEKRIKKAAHKSKKAVLVVYGDNAAPVWWKQNQAKLSQFGNISVVFFNDQTLSELEALVERTMQLQLTIEGEQGWLSAGESSCTITPDWWLR